MNNIPQIKVGIVAVSRDCFPIELSIKRRKALVEAYQKKYNKDDIYECPICIFESEIDMVKSLEDVKAHGCNALCVFLGNFGPEISETLLAKHFDGPKMFIAAEEENIGVLSSDRGDAYCGLLNASYNLKLRNINAYIPESPVGDADDLADRIHDFLPIARTIVGLNNLKIITLAQYELTLLDWVEKHRGYRKYVAIAGKCWPAFQTMFGFVPCYVNSRLTMRGIPVSCEVDIYGALSEYIGTCVSQSPVTLLDINNTLPKELYKQDIEGKYNYAFRDTFMGFHCGNTCTSLLCKPEMKYQKIMARALPKEVTNGTLEGDIKPGDITFYRLQSTSDNHLLAYVAEGEVLPVPTHSFGSIGVFAIKEMNRFYRHVLIENGFPHHGAVAFGHYGKTIFEVFKYLNAEKIGYNQPKNLPYPTENPFENNQF